MRLVLALLLAALLVVPVGAALGTPISPSYSAPAPVAAPATPGTASGVALATPLSDPAPAGPLPWPFHGVDRSGTEYACIQGWGYGDGWYNLTSVEAMRSWNVTAVRVPLNEDCWLDINVNGTSAAAYSGTSYRAFIVAYVDLLESQGIRPILDLHWNAPGTNQSTGQEPMADESHAPGFWASVASTFANDSLVVFDLYNEPYGISWSCWLNGCFQTYTDPGWETAGMQQLLDVVRSTGADTQLVILGGLNWSNDESGWLSHMPTDPAGPGHLAVSLHMYEGNSCGSESCWNSTLLPIVDAGIPIVTGELGETDCEASFVHSYFHWADPLDISYLGWTWDTWASCDGPTLISTYQGAPYMDYGAAFEQQLLNFSEPALLAPSAPATVTPVGDDGSVLVHWSAPASNGTWPATNEELAWGTSAGALTQDLVTGVGGDQEARVSGLTDLQAYYFAVRERNNIGWGAWSTPAEGTPAENLSLSASATPTSGSAPLVVSFVVTPLGGQPTLTYAWTFGDGGTSTAQDPTHTYTQDGSFVATVTATDGAGRTAQAGVDVTVTGGTSTLPLVVWANASTASGTAPLWVAFDASARGGVSPYAYAWRFGDGGAVTGPEVTHTFEYPGTFVVWLWVNDSAGDSTTASTSVEVSTVPSTLAIHYVVSPSTLQYPPEAHLEVSAWPTGGVAPYTSMAAKVFFNGSSTLEQLTAEPGHSLGGTSFNFTFNGTGEVTLLVGVLDSSGSSSYAWTNLSIEAAACGCGSSPVHSSSAGLLGLPGDEGLYLVVGVSLAVAAAVVLVILARRRRSPPRDGAPDPVGQAPYPPPSM